MVRLDFDSSNVQPQDSFDPIPAGWYAMSIVACEQRDTKSGTGAYLNLQLQVDETAHPEVGKRVVFDRLNLWNDNVQAVEIAQRTLSAICKAVGVIKVEDSDQLLGHRLAVKVTVRPARDGYDASNEVKGYDDVSARIQGATNGTRPTQQAKPAPVQPTAASVPPWKRG